MIARRCAAEGCTNSAEGSINDLGYCLVSGHVTRVMDRARGSVRAVRKLARELRYPRRDDPPVARNTDPATSHAAAAALDSALRSDVQRAVYAFILDQPGSIRGEIGDALPWDQPEVWRRVSDVKNAGLIFARGSRRWSGTGRQQSCWWPVTESPAVQERLV